MTEIERIIEKGVISSDFLKEEIICDFRVDEQRKKLWAISLDLLMELDSVCRKYNLKYFLIGGSLLGAVRHAGFIPWDDDIDVGMLREDYEKFMTLGTEFKEPYFLQTPYTDDGYFFSYNKLRNSNTTSISMPFMYEKFNQGIALDIFPIDKCKPEDVEERFHKINELIMDNSAYMRRNLKNPSEQDKIRINSHSGRMPMDVYEELQNVAMQYRYEDTEYANLAVCTVYSFDRLMFKKHIFDDIVYIDFENLKVPVPAGYDEYLKTSFGNYMELPPINQRGVWHSSAYFNMDKSYLTIDKDNINSCGLLCNN